MFQDFYRAPDVQDNDFLNNGVPLQLNCTGHESWRHRLHAGSKRQDYYLFYLCCGQVDVECPIHATLRAGDMIVYPADTPYAYGSRELPTEHYFAHFTGYAAADLLSMCGIQPSTVYHVGRAEDVSHSFDALFHTFIARDALFDADSAARLWSLLVSIGRWISPQDSHPTGQRQKPLSASVAYIHRHFAEELSVRMLADMEFLSESRFRARFHALMKQAPTDYIARLRIRAACELLRLTDTPIGEIAQSVGYADARYFSRLFRERIGMTPSEYRAGR